MLTQSGKVRCLFGTDGVRDVANRGAMTPEMVLSLARAYVWWMVQNGVSRPSIVVGRDTRRSGEMLEAAVVAGLASGGADALVAGVLPTPGVSHIVAEGDAKGGVVISASHNPAEDNGIKFFDARGRKLSDEDEAIIEEYLDDHMLDEWRPTGASVGRVLSGGHLRARYVAHLAKVAEGLRMPTPLVVDCAHGAACVSASELFARFPGVELVAASPDGLNINEDVGVLHLNHVASQVRKRGAAIGMAFDGDADRVLFVDGRGRPIDGDILLWVLARWLDRRGSLGSGVVATVMSNLALEEHLERDGIAVFRCPVGDRYVLETMERSGAALGGEQSGHVIARDFVATGDGLCTALLFLRACAELGEDVATLSDRFARYPQMLRNVPVRDKRRIAEHPRLKEAVAAAEERMSGRGRVFVRPSGTESMLRILVEAKEPSILEEVCGEIESHISAINAGGEGVV